MFLFTAISLCCFDIIICYCRYLLAVGCVRSQYQLTAPLRYTVLGGDIQVSYSLPLNASVGGTAHVQHRVQLESDSEVITAVPVSSKYREGVLTFICGVVDYAGRFVFKLLEPNGGQLTQTDTMVATWPDSNLTLPPSVAALTGDVTLHMAVTGAQCKSLHSSVGYLVRVVYMGANDTHGRPTQNPDKHLVIYEQEYTDILKLADVSVNIACQKLDQSGMYRAELTSTRNPLVPLGSSNHMYVHWSTVYELRSAAPSVFPCQSHVVVQYTHARCAGAEDKVRLYKQVQRAASSIASPIDLEYVAERRATRALSAAIFDCYLFEQEVPGYCFVYVSTAENGAVTEQYTLCLPTQPPPGN